MARPNFNTYKMKKKIGGIIVLIFAVVACYFDWLPISAEQDVVDNSEYAVRDAQLALEVPRTGENVSERVLTKQNYTLSFNKKNNIPNWVAWQITADELIERESRTNDFQPDPELDSRRAVTTYDYVGSGYDRGHMCPAADNRYHWKAMRECFYMTNMCPQHHHLNAGLWNDLEQQCRRMVNERNSLYVVCGPIMYENVAPRYIGEKNKVRVPDAFFKVILSGMEQDRPKGMAYVFANDVTTGSLRNYACSIDEVEEITGFDFFHLLPDDVEKEVER